MKALSLTHLIRPPVAGANAANARPPLLLLLHGVGSNEQSMSRLAPAFDPRFLVVSARSPITLGPNSFAWFHVTFTAQGPMIDSNEAKVGWTHLAHFIDEVIEAYSADPARVFIVGFSQGGIMALAALLTAPEQIAGVAMMSGRLLPEVIPYAAEPARLRDKPLLIVHGISDEKLGIHFARSAREQLARFSLALTYRELAMGHTVSEESVAAVAAWLGARLAAVSVA